MKGLQARAEQAAREGKVIADRERRVTRTIEKAQGNLGMGEKAKPGKSGSSGGTQRRPHHRTTMMTEEHWTDIGEHSGRATKEKKALVKRSTPGSEYAHVSAEEAQMLAVMFPDQY